MTKIEIIQDIKHDGQQFYAGESRVVTDHLAGYFCGNGWAKYPSGETTEADTSPKTLQVHDSHQGHLAITP